MRRTLALLPSLTHLRAPDALIRWRLFRFSPYFTEGAAHGVRRGGPTPEYAWLYPPRAPLEDIAYRFSYELERPCASQADADAVESFVNLWRTRWQQSTFLRYAAGPGFVRVYDYRLASALDQQPSLRRPLLEGLDAEVILACRQARGPIELARLLEADEAETRAALERLCALRLIYGDGARYSTLAQPLPSQPDRFLETVQMLEALEHGDLRRDGARPAAKNPLPLNQ